MSGEFKGFVDRWEKAADDTRQIVASMSDAFLLVDVTASNIVPRRWAHMAGRTIYRVDTRKQHVEVRAWGIGESTHIVAREIMRYDNVQVLPEWMQRKIATLMIFDPAQVNDESKGLGRRISKGTFWLYPDEGEDDGNDARAPS